MSFRSQMADVKSGKVSYYKKQDNGIGEGFANFANIIAKDMMQDDRDEKEEEKLRLKEEKAERKRIATATAAQEAKDKKMKTAAQMLATTFSGDKSNAGAVEYFYGQLSIFDGDVDAVMGMAKTMVDNKSLNFTPRTEETLSFQGPTVPANAKISDFNAGFGATSEPKQGETEAEKRKRELGFGEFDEFKTPGRDGKDVRLNDLKGIEESDKSSDLNKGQAKQMREMFGGLSEGTPLPADQTVVTEGSVEVTAYGQGFEELDYSRLNDKASIENYLLAVKNGDIKLSSEDTRVVENQLKLKNDATMAAAIRAVIADPEAAKAENDTNIAMGTQNTRIGKIIASIHDANVKGLKPWEDYIAPDKIIAAKDFSTLESMLSVATELGAKKEDLKVLNAEMAARTEREKTNRDWVTDAAQSKDKAFAAVTLYTQNKDPANLKIAQSLLQSYLTNEPAKYAGILEVSALLGKSYTELVAIESGAISLGAPRPALDFLRKQIVIAQGVEKDAKNLDYIKNSTSFAKTQAQITLATEEKASKELINRLTALAASQQKSTALANAGQTGALSIDAVFKDPVTQKLGYGLLVVGTDGVAKTIDGTVVPEYNGMSEVMTDRFKDIAIQTNKYFNEASTAGVAIAEGLQNAEIVLRLAREDPKVREIGGDIAQTASNFIRGTGGAIEVLGDLFSGGATTVTEAQLRAKLGAKPGSEEFIDSIISGDIQNLGDKTAQFEAAMLSLVFRAGRMEGQSGNAMSNKDFERLQQMLNVKGSFEAFEATVREFMADKIATYDFRATTLLEGAVGSFENDYGFVPVKAPLSFKEFVEKQNNPKLSETYLNTTSFVPNATEKEIVSSDALLNSFVNGKTIQITVGEDKKDLALAQVTENLLKINAEFEARPIALAKARKEFLTGLATAMNTTYDKLMKLGNFE